jgi:hypothetical protein
VLRNRLILNKDDESPGDGRDSVGELQDFFFCGELADEDIPWDITETDW